MSIAGILVRVGIGAAVGVAVYFIIRNQKKRENDRTDRKEI